MREIQTYVTMLKVTVSFLLCSAVDPSSDVAQSFLNIGVEVCSLPAFLEKNSSAHHPSTAEKAGTSGMQTDRWSSQSHLGQLRLK